MRSLLIATSFACLSLAAQAQTSVQFNVGPSADHKEIVISLPQPVSAIDIPAGAADRFVSALGAARAQVVPAIPQQDPARGQPLHVANPGRFYVQPHPDGNGIDIGILDPGFGWVMLRLTGDEGDQLIKAIRQYQYPQ
jgi:hypothetical protein